MKKVVSTKDAPAAIGPYSQAMWAGDYLFCSGQLGLDAATGEFTGADIVSQTEQVLKNIKGLLSSQGLTPANVVKTTVFLKDMKDFAKMNELYAKVFDDNPPARSTFAVAELPKDGLLEIEIVAYKG